MIYLIHDIYLSFGGGNFLFAVNFNHMWAVRKPPFIFQLLVQPFVTFSDSNDYLGADSLNRHCDPSRRTSRNAFVAPGKILLRSRPRNRTSDKKERQLKQNAGRKNGQTLNGPVAKYTTCLRHSLRPSLPHIHTEFLDYLKVIEKKSCYRDDYRALKAHRVSSIRLDTIRGVRR